MGTAFSSLDGLVRNPVTVRLVANSLLLLSDVDVVFSVLFTLSIVQIGGLGMFFGAVLVLGQMLYLVGVCYFAPRQKYQTMDLIKDMMKRIPNEFKDPTTNQLISATSPVARNSSGSGTTFAALPRDDNGYEQFKAGMSAYGLLHLWTVAECKNARNCAEMSHGVPFFRLAAYGFMAQSSAKDLAGILNCNALYTFTTGIPMMAFGAFLFTQTPPTTQSLLPLVFSAASLLLSLANILFDFSSILQQLDDESRLQDDILGRSAAELEARKNLVRRERESRLMDIENQFLGVADEAALREKGIRSQHVNETFARALDMAGESNLELVQIELNDFRRRVSVIRAQLRGREMFKSKVRASAVDKYAKRRENLDEALQKIDDEFDNVVKQITSDIANLDAATLEQKFSAAQTERDKKTEIIQRQIDALRGSSANDQEAGPVTL